MNYSYRVASRNEGYAVERTSADPADPRAVWTAIEGHETLFDATCSCAEHERMEYERQEEVELWAAVARGGAT